MTTASLLILGLLITVSLENTCPVYICDPGLAAQECASMSVQKGIAYYRLRECNDTSQCDLLYGDKNDKCAAVPTMQTKYPGEWCQLDSQCTSFKCEGTGNETFCTAGKLDTICSEDLDCDAGLFCNRTSHLCAKVSNKGQPCSDDLPCNAYTTCNWGTCVVKGSLATGVNSTSSSGCKSQHLRNGKCADGPKLDRNTERKDPTEGPIFCPNEKTASCSYTYAKGDTIADRCVCGRNNANQMVCATGAGDIDMSQVNTVLAFIISMPIMSASRRTALSHAIFLRGHSA